MKQCSECGSIRWDAAPIRLSRHSRIAIGTTSQLVSKCVGKAWHARQTRLAAMVGQKHDIRWQQLAGQEHDGSADLRATHI
jgi:hypothetical protein